MKKAALVLAAAVSLAAAPEVSQALADAFQQKLVQIVQQAEARKSSQPRQTTVTEPEVNSYLRFRAGDQLPVGVTDPSVTIHDHQGRLSGRAIVDLDLIRRQKSSGAWMDPTSYLTGRLPVTAAGTLRTSGGRGQFSLETAAVNGVPIPKAFLQEIVSYYTRSDDLPDGLNIDKPFNLPAEIQRIDVQPGKATIVQ